MHNFRAYISMLFLVLLLFPMAEKVHHELGDAHERHCDSKGLHYCAQEHSCSVCDYVFASSFTPPDNKHEFSRPVQVTDKQIVSLPGFLTSAAPYILSLRGPPVS